MWGREQSKREVAAHRAKEIGIRFGHSFKSSCRPSEPGFTLRQGRLVTANSRSFVSRRRPTPRSLISPPRSLNYAVFQAQKLRSVRVVASGASSSHSPRSSPLPRRTSSSRASARFSSFSYAFTSSGLALSSGVHSRLVDSVVDRPASVC